eukprot:TRINITY_DN12551_c0_g2_i3.p1 TRINITY_DN12551_c0_g2~~TRINITY_DN12551_c0_g2_i3.p1  ORF type:complete len:119 (-),score=10.14 TRINITY_DN12551_c0_g2_i3:765-1121(-)
MRSCNCYRATLVAARFGPHRTRCDKLLFPSPPAALGQPRCCKHELGVANMMLQLSAESQQRLYAPQSGFGLANATSKRLCVATGLSSMLAAMPVSTRAKAASRRASQGQMFDISNADN